MHSSDSPDPAGSPVFFPDFPFLKFVIEKSDIILILRDGPWRTAAFTPRKGNSSLQKDKQKK